MSDDLKEFHQEVIRELAHRLQEIGCTGRRVEDPRRHLCVALKHLGVQTMDEVQTMDGPRGATAGRGEGSSSATVRAATSGGIPRERHIRGPSPLEL
eukprot:sb/3479081/